AFCQHGDTAFGEVVADEVAERVVAEPGEPGGVDSECCQAARHVCFGTADRAVKPAPRGECPGLVAAQHSHGFADAQCATRAELVHCWNPSAVRSMRPCSVV